MVVSPSKLSKSKSPRKVVCWNLKCPLALVYRRLSDARSPAIDVAQPRYKMLYSTKSDVSFGAVELTAQQFLKDRVRMMMSRR